MFIDINKIGEDGLDIDEQLDLGNLEDAGGEPIPLRSVRLRGRVARSAERVEFRGGLEAVGSRTCGRCLESYDLEISTEFYLRLVSDEPEPEAHETEVDPEDATIFHAPEGRADLGLMAREQIYLDLAMKPVCSTDCKGLCPVCGANRNLVPCGCREETVDPRLAPLGELKRRIEES